MTVQSILLGLGTLLLAVAAVVFTAVNWSRMDAATQGVILLAMTAAVAVATAVSARHRLPATAESLGLVTLVLAMVDAHAVRVSSFPHAALAAYWAFGLAAVAALGWAMASATGIRSTRLVAVVVGQVPLGLSLLAADVDWGVAGVALIAQATLVAVATSPRTFVGTRLDRLTRIFAVIPALYTWVVVTTGAAAWLGVEGARANPALVGVAVAATASAALTAWCWSRRDDVRLPALVAATVTGLASVGWLARLALDGELAWACVGIASAAVVGAGLRTDDHWGSAPAATAAWGVGITGLTVLGPTFDVVERIGAVTSDAWGLQAADRAVSPAHTGRELHSTALLVHLVGLCSALWALAPRISRRSMALAGLSLFAVTIVVAPVLLPLSIGGAAAAAWGGAVAVLVTTEIWTRARRPLAVAGIDAQWAGAVAAPSVDPSTAAAVPLRAGALFATMLLVLAGYWSSATEALSIVTGSVVIAGAIWVLARAWAADDQRLATASTAVGVLAVGIEAALVAAATGTAGLVAVACGAAAALAACAVAMLVLPRQMSVGAQASAWFLHAVGILTLVGAAGTGDPGLPAAWRITLMSGVIAAVIRATRDRGPASEVFVAVAACEGLAFWWIELAAGGVSAPEPYTLALAGLLLAVGLVVERRLVALGEPLPGSWTTMGPALLVAAVPTVWLSLVEPGGYRPLLALVAGVAILATGAFTGRRALVDVGAGSVATLATARLLPVLADAPNWLTIGFTGAVLVAVGATFEQRRQDARGMRDRYGALR